MINIKDDFLKKLFGFSLGPFFSAIIGFVMTPITTWLVMPAEFGKASMYTTAFSVFSLFVYLGVDQSFVREFHSQTKKKDLFWNSFLIPFSFSFLVSLLILMFKEGLSVLLFGVESDFILYVLAISLPVSIIRRFNLLLIRLQEKAKLYSFMSVLQRVINFVLLLILLLTYEKTFKSIVMAQFFALLSLSLFLSYINRKYWLYHFIFDKALFKSSLKFGLPLIPSSIFMWILNSMDKIALRTWSTFNELGLYSAAFKIVGVFQIVQVAFNTFWIPTAYKWYENDVKPSSFEKVGKILTFFFTFLFGLIVLFKDIFILIFDKSYINASSMIPFLLFFPMMVTITSVTSVGIGFKRKNSYTILTTGIAALVNYFGNSTLVPILGGVGASISTALSFLTYFLLSTLISRKLWSKFKLKHYFVNIICLLSLSFISVFTDFFWIESLVFLFILCINFKDLKEISLLAFRFLFKK